MKRIMLVVLAGALIVGVGTLVSARQSIYRWVKDRHVCSDDLLRQALRERVVNLPEAQVLEAVRRVMTDDLFLSLAAYHATKHVQDAETTVDTVLPEDVVRQQDIELVDDNYDKFRFILQVRLKALGNRTRVAVKAQPMYRVHDLEAEEQANSESAAAVDIKVNADRGQAVGLGPVFVVPVEGALSDYQIEILPDAADRAAKLVRSFIYLLDKRVAQPPSAPSRSISPHSATTQAVSPQPVPSQDQQPQAGPPQPALPQDTQPQDVPSSQPAP